MDRENFKNLFNVINDLLFIVDQEGLIVEVNRVVLSVLGYERNELKGQPITCIYPPEYHDKVQKLHTKANHDPDEIHTLLLLSKNHSQIPVEVSFCPGIWDDNNVLIAVIRNLSEIAFSEEKFYRVFNNNQALMALLEVGTGKVINVNKSFLQVLGYLKSEVIGKDFQCLPVFYESQLRKKLAEQIISNIVFDNEYLVLRTREGKPVHCLFSSLLIKIHIYNYILISANDITPLKQVENKLKRNLAQQTLLFEISHNFLSIDHLGEKIQHTLDLLGVHTGVSRVYIFEDNITGVKSSNSYEWCNTGVKSQIRNLQNVPYKKIPSWKEILEKKGRLFSINIDELPEDIVALLKSQGIKSILVFPLIVQERFFGFIGFDECHVDKVWETDEIELLETVSEILSNAYERMTYQKQLKESEMRLKLAVENTETGLWDLNVRTNEIYHSKVWNQILGYDIDDIEPTVEAWKKIVHPDDQPVVVKAIDEHIKGNTEYYMMTYRLLTKSGKWKWVIDKGKAVEYDGNNKPLRVIGTIIDFDYQKRTEDELRNLIIAKDNLFSIIAHDLRAPIGAMMQLSELVVNRELLTEDTLNEFLNSQKELSQSTYQLLDNLLNWAIYNKDQVQYHPKKIDLNFIINEIIIQIKFQAVQKGISIITKYNTPFEAYADQEMVKIIVRNILYNALKFTNQGGNIKIKLQYIRKFLEVSFVDTGIGISAENINKILSDNQFFSTQGTSNEKGTGLGLKLCKGFVAQHGGDFKIKSKPNKGTVISFTLPRNEDTAGLLHE